MKLVTFVTFAVSALAAATCVAEEIAPTFSWDHRGYRSILGAAPLAKKKGRRILVGLSGGPS
jgi:hypothetical protein